MQDNILLAQSSLITWVLIADTRQAQIYVCNRLIHQIPLGGSNKHHHYDEKIDFKITPIPNGVLRAESINDYKIGHDRRGTSSSGNGPTHNTYEPHGDINEELKHRFARKIADKIQKSCAENLFDRLVFVAPPPMIAELKGQWSTNVTERIAAIVPKGLMHYQGMALMAHLRDALTEAHVP